MNSKIKLIFLILSLAVLIVLFSIGLYYLLNPIIGIDPTTRLINAAISSAAFLLAFYAIYLSHLKGPDIDLLNKKEIRFKLSDELNLPEEIKERGNIATNLKLEPFDLIFVNKGSRTGIIKDVNLKFNESDDFRPFFAKFEHGFEGQYSSVLTDEEKPFTIVDGEVILVKLSFARIHIKRFDSFQKVYLPNDFKRDDIVQVIQEMLNIKKGDLEGFIDFLESGNRLGRCSLYWASTTYEEEIILNVTGSYESMIDFYRNALQKWDDLYPTIPEILIQVEKLLKYFNGTLEKQLTYIPHFEEKARPFDRLFNNEYRPDMYYVLLNWKKKLIDDLENLNKDILKFNRKIWEYKRAQKHEIVTQHILNEINDIKNKLEPHMKDVLIILNKTLNEVTRSIKQLTSEKERKNNNDNGIEDFIVDES